MIGVLFSYWLFKDDPTFEETLQRCNDANIPVFADSGAFSAKHSGAEIDIDQYAKWLHRYKEYFEVYANLDVIRNAQASDANQRILEGNALLPLPVYHAGSEWSVLEGLLDRYDYVGVGGIAGGLLVGNAQRRFALRVFMLARDKGNKRIHGFGFTRGGLVTMFPWHSIDSTTWSFNARMGSTLIYDPKRGFHVQVMWNNLRSYKKQLHHMGFSVDQAMAGSRKVDAELGYLISLRAIQMSLATHRRKHRSELFYYLATYNPNDTKEVLNAFISNSNRVGSTLQTAE